MKITRRDLDIRSAIYSREFDVERSAGCHLMEVVTRIEKTTIDKRKREELSEQTLERLRAAGFLWEHVMSRTERFEHAFSVEAIRTEVTLNPDLYFPGELAYCPDCDDVMVGGQVAKEHARSTGHKLLFFTLDAINTARERTREWKFTWMSAGKTGPDHMNGIWKWPVQNMFYTWGVRLMGGELQAAFACGDYKFPMFLQTYEFDLDYTERELENNARMIVSHARKWGMI